MARSGIPPVTKIFLAILILCSFITFILRYSAYIHLLTSAEHNDHKHLMNGQSTELNSDKDITGDVSIPNPHQIYVPLVALVTGDSVIKKPWTLFTGAFVEDGVVSFLTTFFLILYTGRYIEVLWGSREFLKYLTMTVILSNSIVFIVLSILKLFTNNSDDENDVPLTGSISIIVALLIAIKQRIPNHYLLFLNGFIRLRVSLVPFTLLAFFNIVSLIYPYYRVTSMLSWAGFFVSWTYLRFYKEGGSGRQLSLLPEANNETIVWVKGDRTNQFALRSFFPIPFSIVVGLIANKWFNILVSLNILNAKDFHDDSEEIEQELNNEILTVSNTTQNDLVSSMTQSRLFTSSSFSGVSGSVPFFALPKDNPVSKIFKKLLNKDPTDHSISELEAQKQLDKRRKLALMQLDSKVSD